MMYSIPLEHLPDGLALSIHLRDRIDYSPVTRRLNFIGFMTKGTYDELIALSSNSKYRQAVERLFVLSPQELRPHRENARSS
jgi:hypothetical protein